MRGPRGGLGFGKPETSGSVFDLVKSFHNLVIKGLRWRFGIRRADFFAVVVAEMLAEIGAKSFQFLNLCNGSGCHNMGAGLNGGGHIFAYVRKGVNGQKCFFCGDVFFFGEGEACLKLF